MEKKEYTYHNMKLAEQVDPEEVKASDCRRKNKNKNLPDFVQDLLHPKSSK